MSLLGRLFVLLLLPIFLIGCSSIPKPSFIQYRDKHYLSARSIPPLKIPPGISSDAFQNRYPIPDRNYPESAKTVSIEPPGL